MDVRLPNGVLIRGVPKGTSKEQVARKAVQGGYATWKDFGIQEPQKAASEAQPVKTGVIEQFLPDMPDREVDPLAQKARESLAGTKRGITDAIEGITQLSRMAGEKLGFVSPEEIEQQNTLIEQGRRRYEESPEGRSIAGKLGRLAGNVLVYAPIPGGVGGGALRRAGTAALTGGAVGGAQYVAPGESRAKNVMLGAGLGGLGSLGVSGINQMYNAAMRQFRDPNMARLVATSESQQVPLYYPDVSGPHVMKLSQKMEEVPVVGMAGPRAAQNIAARRSAEQMRSGALERAGREDIGEALQESLIRGAENARGGAKALYNRVTQSLDPYGIVPTPQFNKQAERLFLMEASKKPEYQKKALIDLLNKYNKPPEVNFSGIRALRSDIGDDISDYYTGANALIGKKGVGILQQLKKALERDMEDFARVDPAAYREYLKANRFYRTHVAKRYKAKDIAHASTAEDVDSIFNKFVKTGNYSKARQLFLSLDKEGRDVMRFGIIDRAYQKAVREGDKVFSPAKFASELERLNKPIKAVFNKRDARELQGLQNLMRHIKRSGEYMENPPTGNRNVQILLAALFGYGATTQPGVVAGAVTGTGGLKWLFTSPAGRNLLLASSEIKPGTQSMDRMIATMANALPKAAAIGATQ